jgi:transposase
VCKEAIANVLIKKTKGRFNMKIIKQAVGNDISKDTITYCFGSISDAQDTQISKPITVKNNPKGFIEILHYVEKLSNTKEIPLFFVMEATGVYYEKYAHFLIENNHKVVVVLPNKIKHYAKTLEIKSKTDNLDAIMITRFSLERKLCLWSVPNTTNKELKCLTREYHTIKKSITQLKNQIHAKEYSYEPMQSSIYRKEEILSLYEKQLIEIEKQIIEIIKTDNELNSRINKIKRIEGVGIMTIASIIAETDGFALIENTKQLASYAGLDVVYNESGQKKNKTSISKKGNKNIRVSLFMPAMCACRYNGKMKEFYKRLVEKNKLKRVAQIAVARKLLILIYTIYKKNVEYIPNYNATST